MLHTNDVPCISVITQVNCDEPLIIISSSPTVHCPLTPTQYWAHLNNNYPVLTLSSPALSQIVAELLAKIIAVVVTLS